MLVKNSIIITCPHCGEKSTTSLDYIACKNPACGAPIRPQDSSIYTPLGRAVTTLSIPPQVVYSNISMSPVLPLSQMASHVIDISKWQYKWTGSEWLPPDFVKIRDETDGIHIIHKSSQGTFDDPTYELGRQLITAAYLPYGTYHFADPVYSAVQSAQYYAGQINAIAAAERWGIPEYPQHWVDLEKRTGPDGTPLSKDALTEWVENFIFTLQGETDQYFGIYCRPIWWDDYIWPVDWAYLYPLWSARYNLIIPEPGEPNDWSKYGKKPVLWQREADGNLKGAQYGVWSASIDLSKSPLYTTDQVLQICGRQAPPPPPAGDFIRCLVDRQAFRSEPSTRGGDTTVIRRLSVGETLEIVPDDAGIRLHIPGASAPNDSWAYAVDASGAKGWLAVTHPSRSTVFVETTSEPA